MNTDKLRTCRFASVGIALATAGAAAMLLIRDRPTAAVAINVRQRETIDVGGEERHYRLIVPQTLPDTRVPLVIAYHGMGESAASMAEYAGLDQWAAQEQVLIALPEMARGTWATSHADAISPENPDVRMFDALLDRLVQGYPVDAQRVYVLGMSNGASFAQLLLHVRSHRIAAVVAHSGPPPRALNGVEPEQRCPIMLLVGTDDSRFVVDDIREAARSYRESGHAVELIEVDGLEHAWSREHDGAIRDFIEIVNSSRNKEGDSGDDQSPHSKGRSP